MNRKSAVFWFAALALIVAAPPAHAQSNGAPPPIKTIWDGVYTVAQADRGQRAVQQNCGACHTPTEWSNNMFISSWSGRSIGDLQTHLRTTMPFDSPGRLTAAQYTDIVAYMLKLNDVPAGDNELPSESEALKKITVTRQAGR
jgi:mono/diheme cytochrome c family protein